MKNLFSLAVLCPFWINIFSQQLFVTKRDYSDPSNYIHSLVEIDQEDGSTLSSYDFITEFINSYSPESFVFNEQTNQIIGIAGRTVVKYNPTTNAESSFELPELQSVDYGDLVMIHNNTLGLNKPFQQIIKLQPIKAYNLLGKEVPTHTKNEIIIVLFGNGTSKKIFVKK